MLIVLLIMRLLLKLNNAPASAAKGDPTRPNVVLASIPRPILYLTGWIDIQSRVFGEIAFNRKS